MGRGPYLLAIDQGTTSTRAILFDARLSPCAQAQAPLRQSYPQDGWVEHDPLEIWSGVLETGRAALAGVDPAAVAAIGLTNQRETTLVWDRETGVPLAPAIVWQDRRTAPMCQRLRSAGREAAIQQKTGLLADPYFSATKLAWLLDSDREARARAQAGRLAFGTVDSWLVWKLTGGRVHATDATNAARTMLFNTAQQAFDPEILSWFQIPAQMLPEVRDSAASYGETEPAHFGRAIPITGVAGDQHAALVGQACFAPGFVKATYGTGCFALVNTGPHRVQSQHRLLGTLAYRMGGAPVFAVEGSIFMAGAIVQWLRDGLGLIATSEETAALAAAGDPRSRAVLVPAFTGLGAPYWVPEARAALLGLTRDTGRAEIVRAALEAVSFQTQDLITAMGADMAAAGLPPPAALRVDGGMVRNDWLCQNLADILNLPIERPQFTETTALGAAALAGMGAGVLAGPEAVSAVWRLDRRFEPAMADGERKRRLDSWRDAVGRVLAPQTAN